MSEGNEFSQGWSWHDKGLLLGENTVGQEE